MLNSGLTLRFPYESEYNVYRRFLVANGRTTIQDIRKELIQIYSNSYPSIKYQYNYLITEKLEKDRCRELNISIAAPLNLKLTNKVIHNCTECAKSCYHSEFYGIPWLKLCPIHKCPLTKSCAECGKPWPKISELPMRKCISCGSKMNWDNLKKAHRLRHDKKNTYDLSVLNRSLKIFNEETKCVVMGKFFNNKIWDTHGTIKHENIYFPSVITSLYPPFKSSYDAMGVKIVEMKQFLFEFHDLSKSKKIARQDLYDIQKTIAKRVSTQIVKAINRHVGKLDHEKVLRRQSEKIDRIDTLPKLLVTAFNTWLGVINDNFNYGREYFRPYGSNYFPKTPYPLSMLGFYKDNYISAISDLLHDKKKAFGASESMMIQMYKIDLWRTYLIILNYLNIHRYALKHELSWMDFFKLLPQDSHPSTQNQDIYAFFKISENQLLAFVPAQYVEVSLNDYKLYNP